jgi:hypothetical protein
VNEVNALPAIRLSYYVGPGKTERNFAVCRAGHEVGFPDGWLDWANHGDCEPFRWLGEDNCEEAHALLGWEHSKTELDHSQILGLGPGGDMVAHPGDRLIPDGAGWFYPMAEDEYQAATRGR